jgi:hypothetical protein
LVTDARSIGALEATWDVVAAAVIYKGVELRRFIGDASVLEDDFAPVDQLRD